VERARPGHDRRLIVRFHPNDSVQRPGLSPGSFCRAPRPRRAGVPDHDHEAELPRHPQKRRSTRAKAAKWGAAVYMARWVNTRGKKGPWSEVTTATVAA
jgi:hypothetical protein